jgi:hypothetical protein
VVVPVGTSERQQLAPVREPEYLTQRTFRAHDPYRKRTYG